MSKVKQLKYDEVYDEDTGEIKDPEAHKERLAQLAKITDQIEVLMKEAKELAKAWHVDFEIGSGYDAIRYSESCGGWNQSG